MTFAWPWLFLLLPLPWFLYRLLPPIPSGAALRVPRLPTGSAETSRQSAWRLGIAALVWLLLVAAAARPQMPGEILDGTGAGRDIMLAFDVSASMGTRDMSLAGQPASRLQAARFVANQFLARRRGDRVGLIVFGSQAYLHTPLTFDLEAVRTALATVEVGLAGRETALGDAVGLATKHLMAMPEESRVLVILTDGANTAGTLTPRRATWLARRAGVRIYAVGIGRAAKEGATKTDEDAAQAVLADMARQTSGVDLRGADRKALEDFFHRLDQLEAREGEGAIHRLIKELYFWPLGAALILSFLLAWRPSLRGIKT